MKNIILLFFLFFALNVFCQENLCRTSIWDNSEVFEKNEINKYKNYDFSNLWNSTENNSVYGIIGDNYQRILIKFISIKRNEKSKNEYIVRGKSNVKSNTCDFVGTITIIKIQELKKLKFGIDDEYKNAGIKSQGFLIANYKFIEDIKKKIRENFKESYKPYFILINTV